MLIFWGWWLVVREGSEELRTTFFTARWNPLHILKLIFYLTSFSFPVTISRWWFWIFFIFTPIWGWFPFWLIFFNWVWNHPLDFFLNTFRRILEQPSFNGAVYLQHISDLDSWCILPQSCRRMLAMETSLSSKDMQRNQTEKKYKLSIDTWNTYIYIYIQLIQYILGIWRNLIWVSEK